MQRSLSLCTVTLLLLAAAAACTAPTTPPPSESVACDGDLCTLTGPILEDLTLTADKKWLLKGGVFVGDDSDPTKAPTKLTIEPGTTVYGDTASLSFLLITRGSQIIADGTPEQPIVFTSAKAEGARARQDWGGIVINGRAPVNGCTGDPCVLLGEAGTGTYGGDQEDDDSGILRYVRVEFGGALIDEENELNGFAFQGVGRGTTIDFLQAHMMSDDCIEFFGGTVDAKHIVCTGIGDDNLDWTFGWNGRVQFVVAQQYGDAGGNGIEADNNETNHDLDPRSSPTISNITLVGVPGSANSGIGLLLRRGTEANISNAVVQGFGTRCFDIDDDATFARAENGAIAISDSIFDCDVLTDDAAEDPIVLTDFISEGNTVGDAGLNNPFDIASPDFRPSAGAAAATGGHAPSDSFFDDVTFKGGCGPDSSWMAGWTAMPAN